MKDAVADGRQAGAGVSRPAWDNLKMAREALARQYNIELPHILWSDATNMAMAKNPPKSFEEVCKFIPERKARRVADKIVQVVNSTIKMQR